MNKKHAHELDMEIRETALKTFISYLLISLFLFQAFEVGVVFVQFKLNQDYIAKVLCINKDKPELKCNGCCQLKKEIAEKEREHEKRDKTILPDKPIVFVQAIVYEALLLDITFQSSYPSFSCSFQPNKTHTSIFRLPELFLQS